MYKSKRLIVKRIEPGQYEVYDPILKAYLIVERVYEDNELDPLKVPPCHWAAHFRNHSVLHKTALYGQWCIAFAETLTDCLIDLEFELPKVKTGDPRIVLSNNPDGPETELYNTRKERRWVSTIGKSTDKTENRRRRE